MNTVSRTITGILAILFGLYLSTFGFLEDPWTLIYGIPIIVIGVFIFLYKKEDDIEEIKSRQNLKNK